MPKVCPLVSVGLPTYNRCLGLRRAIDSVLSQTYKNIELVVSDNASSDDTRIVCEEYARRDSRLRYIRQSENVGMISNFNVVLGESSGPYFMWLADDDWLDARYIELCMSVFENGPDYALVAGVNRYYLEGVHVFDCEVVQLTGCDARRRVLDLYYTSAHGGLIYGVFRRECIHREFSNPAVMWEDLYFTAAAVYCGKAAMLESTFVHRSRAGTSSTDESTISHYGVRFRNSFSPHYYRGVHAARDVMRNPAYQSLDPFKRRIFACQTFRYACFREIGPHPIRDAYEAMRARARKTLLWRTLRAVVKR